ncbi:YdcH family protein [Zavarzinia sp. CC-PAN008]|uniref:YdcH family protein n=1 Tax=Zavarzinia sp. CC-PAN008 TaxID=3243332 RepID=UPI003F7423EA
MAVQTEEEETLRRQLADLREEHRDLDDSINALLRAPPVDQLQIQRLKRRKLALKDLMSRIESRLLPDIIA